MENFTSQVQQGCQEKFPCFYRKGGNCTFWKKAEKTPAALKKVFLDDPEDDLQVIDTLREPCLHIVEERIGACEKFKVHEDKGWLDCKACGESLCGYIGKPLKVGDTLSCMSD